MLLTSAEPRRIFGEILSLIAPQTTIVPVCGAGEVVVDLQKALAAHRIDIESATRAFLSREDWRAAAKLAGNPYPSSATLPPAT
jgi:hypothetical protein